MPGPVSGAAVTGRHEIAGGDARATGLAILTPYQARWIADQSDVKVYEKSRRIGISWTEAADSAIIAATAGRRGMDVWYVGYNQDMAKEFIDDAAMWTRRIHNAAAEIEETVIADEKKDILAYQIRYASGYKVVALSSRPSNLRGKGGVAVIDEAAFHDQLGELLKAALAFLMWGGRVHVISTHDGDANPFNELVKDCRAGRKPYRVYRTDFDEAIADGLYHKICEKKGEAWSQEGEREFRAKMVAFYGDNANEELFCIPKAGGGAFIPSIVIEARMKEEVPVIRWTFPDGLMERDEPARVSAAKDFCQEHLNGALKRVDKHFISVFGEDFARSGDLTVIWPLQLDQKLMRRTPFVLELRDVPFNQQKEILFYIVERLPRFTAGALDARGNGQYLAEQAALKWGDQIEQVMLSVPWYRANMPKYKAAFEEGFIELPRDADILSDHRALTMVNGVAQIPDKREKGVSGEQRHGDSAIAGALAYYASTMDPPAYGGYRSAKPARPFNEGSGQVDDERADALGSHRRRFAGF